MVLRKNLPDSVSEKSFRWCLGRVPGRCLLGLWSLQTFRQWAEPEQFFFSATFLIFCLCLCIQDKYTFWIVFVSYPSTHSTLSNLLLMKGSWLVGGVFCEGILGVRLLAGPLIPCWVRVGEIRSSVWGEDLFSSVWSSVSSFSWVRVGPSQYEIFLELLMSSPSQPSGENLNGCVEI